MLSARVTVGRCCGALLLAGRCPTHTRHHGPRSARRVVKADHLGAQRLAASPRASHGAVVPGGGPGRAARPSRHRLGRGSGDSRWETVAAGHAHDSPRSRATRSMVRPPLRRARDGDCPFPQYRRLLSARRPGSLGRPVAQGQWPFGQGPDLDVGARHASPDIAIDHHCLFRAAGPADQSGGPAGALHGRSTLGAAPGRHRGGAACTPHPWPDPRSRSASAGWSAPVGLRERDHPR